jgi:3'-phosphoadenosine 5'-phosphosulfate sulfotransferase (PAPS reductase)/FAD synthetase
MVMKHNKYDLAQMQALPLEAKIRMTQQRIKVWYESWHKFEIINKKNKEKPVTRYVTLDTRDGKTPKIKDYEYINREYDGQVYVSFSGGKDSTVLLHLVREMYPDVEAVFVNTGLEYPEIQKFVKQFDNVTILRPAMRFDEVIKKFGYPMISKNVSHKIHNARNGVEWAQKYVNGTAIGKNGEKSIFNVDKYKDLLVSDFIISHKCCDVMKKSPIKEYTKKTQKKPFTAQMANESKQRYGQWLKKGCNAFDTKYPMSNPMSFWTEQDIYQYIKKYNLPIASVYGDVVYSENPEQIRLEEFDFNCGTEKLETTGCNRTGCIFCGFGCHLEKGESRFERLKITHPRQYDYCLNGGEYDENGIWKPNKQGLGMKHVFDELNKLYGDGFIKY